MASNCYNLWVVYENSKGQKKWVNEGPAPDGECPSCPEAVYPVAGTWNGFSAACQNGSIVKSVADGTGGKMPGDVIAAVGTPKATQACYNSLFIGTGRLSDYFP